MNSASLDKRVQKMLATRSALMDGDVSSLHIKVSRSNRKTGASVPSVSLIPVADCGNCSKCKNGCYDIRNVCYLKSVQDTRANNSALLKADRERYFSEIGHIVAFERFFRWHVGGEIVDADYLRRMVETAEKNPHCSFLVFTKMYGLINGYRDAGNTIPENLHIIFSDWKGIKMDNPYNYPVSSPVWDYGVKGDHCTDNAQWCNGFCEECALKGTGCFGAKEGETILFHAH